MEIITVTDIGFCEEARAKLHFKCGETVREALNIAKSALEKRKKINFLGRKFAAAKYEKLLNIAQEAAEKYSLFSDGDFPKINFGAINVLNKKRIPKKNGVEYMPVKYRNVKAYYDYSGRYIPSRYNDVKKPQNCADTVCNTVYAYDCRGEGGAQVKYALQNDMFTAEIACLKLTGDEETEFFGGKADNRERGTQNGRIVEDKAKIKEILESITMPIRFKSGAPE